MCSWVAVCPPVGQKSACMRQGVRNLALGRAFWRLILPRTGPLASRGQPRTSPFVAEAPDLVARCRDLPAEALCALFVEGLQKKHDATCEVAARALRDKARAGALDDDTWPVLVACLVDAPTLRSALHVAKALAAFGRRAGPAAPYLIERIRAVLVTDDESFWALDGMLHALSYVGDGRNVTFTNELAAQTPSVVMVSRSVYRGALGDDDREAMFYDTLEDVADRLESDDPGTWRTKTTRLAAAGDDDAGGGLKPWMTR